MYIYIYIRVCVHAHVTYSYIYSTYFCWKTSVKQNGYHPLRQVALAMQKATAAIPWSRKNMERVRDQNQI